jgi:hypothetical protein
MASYNKLRRRAAFKKIQAAVTSIEVERGNTGWHPHIHSLVLGNRIQQWDLVNAWAQVSDGHIVDCPPVAPHQVSRVLGYIAKPFVAQDSAELREFLAATEGVQMFRASGSFRGQKVEIDLKEKTSPDARIIGVVKSEDPVIERFLAGTLDCAGGTAQVD